MPNASQPKPKCPCGHAAHAKACPARAGSRCQSYQSPDGATGFICGYRPGCPCPFRTCKCGMLVALAAELPPDAAALPSADTVMLVSVIRGSAGDPAGRLAVRQLTGGHLACRDLPDGEEPGEGEWRGQEHTNGACPKLEWSERDARWLTLQVA
jgi:hypothetical protein